MKKVILFSFSALILWSCANENNREHVPEENGQERDGSIEEPNEDVGEWRELESEAYNFRMQYPSNWEMGRETEDKHMEVISVYSKTVNGMDSPPRIHADASLSFLSILPSGFGTELPSGKSREYRAGELELTFAVNEANSRVFLLENDEAWAWFLSLENPPAGMEQGAFVFMQVAQDNFRTECYETGSGKKKEMPDCDPMGGDEVKRYGDIPQREMQQLKRIVESIEWTEKGNNEEKLSNLIKVAKPLPNNNWKNPQSIKGQARGYWFYEAQFPIDLQDGEGEVLARATATAQDDWMTDKWVNFSARMEYNQADNERLYLVFKRANPSGLQENEREYRLPVIAGGD